MSMKYGEVPGVDKPVSRIAQGLMMIGTGDKLDWSFELLDGVFELGINTFDSSHIYGGGDCDRAFGRWVAERGIRDKVVMLDKCCHHNDARRRVTPFDLTSDLHDCLARLGFDHIDIFVLHRDDPSAPVGPIVEVLNEHKAAGLIGAFGGSNWQYTRVAEANEYAYKHSLTPFAVSSPHFSLAEMVEEPWAECASIAGPDHAADREWYAEHGVALFPWSSLSRGFFSGRWDRAKMEAADDDEKDIAVRCFRSEDNLKRLDRAWELAEAKGVSVPQLVTAWVTHYPLNIFPLIGVWKPEEARQNVEALDLELTPAEMDYLDLKRDEC